jgi:hypothetical protein
MITAFPIIASFREWPPSWQTEPHRYHRALEAGGAEAGEACQRQHRAILDQESEAALDPELVDARTGRALDPRATRLSASVPRRQHRRRRAD